jgi:hypothetical protein
MSTWICRRVSEKSRRCQPGSRPEDFAWAMKALRNVCGLPKNDSDRSSLRWQKENQQLRGADELVEAAQKSENQDEAVLGRRRGNTMEATDIRRIMGKENLDTGYLP